MHTRNTLDIKRWAEHLQDGGLEVPVDGPMETPVEGSRATGRSLVTNGELGVDLLRLAAGDGFSPHTHPGDHILIIVAGLGTITYSGNVYPTEAGKVYMIDGKVPHAVGAITDHAILAVGAPHKAVDALDRMELVEYAAAASEVGDLNCLICTITAAYPSMLHDHGCPHCPCSECNPAS